MKQDGGFECVNSVEWRGWVPGEEYRKVLPIKNVSRFVQTLNWKKPACPCFDTEFYGPLRVNPGVTAAVGLLFRPSKRSDFTSQLHFSATKGSFSVILKGLSPAGHIQCQKNLSLGTSAVNATAQQFFPFTNPGSDATSFEWVIEPPFFIAPKGGYIEGEETIWGTCYFSPEKACSYSTQATCIVHENSPAIMHVDGTGKHDSFKIQPSILEFGDVLVGSARQLVFSILNTSDIVAKIRLDVVDDHIHPSLTEFSVDLTEGLIPPNEFLSVKGVLLFVLEIFLLVLKTFPEL